MHPENDRMRQSAVRQARGVDGRKFHVQRVHAEREMRRLQNPPNVSSVAINDTLRRAQKPVSARRIGLAVRQKFTAEEIDRCGDAAIARFHDMRVQDARIAA